MAVEPVTDENQPGEVGRHARDYSRFLTLMKWIAIPSFLIAMFVITFVIR